MGVDVRIEGNTLTGTLTSANVTSIGQLVVAPFDYDTTQFIELAEPNTAFNFYEPRDGQHFVITRIIAKADKDVSNVTDATVIIYEADSATELTVVRVLVQLAMTRHDLLPPAPLNLLINTGMFVNAKTDDDNIHMTIMGYYRPV